MTGLRTLLTMGVTHKSCQGDYKSLQEWGGSFTGPRWGRFPYLFGVPPGGRGRWSMDAKKVGVDIQGPTWGNSTKEV